jgi:hypothetical protein
MNWWLYGWMKVAGSGEGISLDSCNGNDEKTLELLCGGRGCLGCPFIGQGRERTWMSTNFQPRIDQLWIMAITTSGFNPLLMDFHWNKVASNYGTIYSMKCWIIVEYSEHVVSWNNKLWSRVSHDHYRTISWWESWFICGQIIILIIGCGWSYFWARVQNLVVCQRPYLDALSF